jgi:hypothetical protein
MHRGVKPLLYLGLYVFVLGQTLFEKGMMIYNITYN